MKPLAGRTAVFTIGHSTRRLEQFLGLLHDNGVEVLVDVRTAPRSRHNPQYDSSSLSNSLHESRIEYRGMKGLSGLRRPSPKSANLGWRNASFRGFADYMQTSDFKESLESLMEIAREKPTAVMCAEAVPWRCHRSLIADVLTVRHFAVLHIIGKGSPRMHSMTRFAKIKGMNISYPGTDSD